MLGKLLKYEFNATGRILLPLFGATLIVGIVNGFIPFNHLSLSHSGVASMTKGVAMLLFVSFFIASVGLSFLVSILRFKKNILGSEGYLMNTIPVGPMQNVAAKLITAVVYQIVGIFVGGVSFELFNGGQYIGYRFRSWIKYLSSMNATDWGDAILTCLFFLLGIALFNVAVYASLSVGHSFNGAKVIKSIGTYLVLFIAGSFVFGILTSIAAEIPMLYVDALFMIGTELVYIIIGLIITNYFLKNRLNLE